MSVEQGVKHDGVALHFIGPLSRDETIKRLEAQRLEEQHALKSVRPLQQLDLLEVMAL